MYNQQIIKPTAVNYRQQVENILKQVEQYEYEQKCPLRAIIPINQVKHAIRETFETLQHKTEETLQQVEVDINTPKVQKANIDYRTRNNKVLFFCSSCSPICGSVCTPYRDYTRYSYL